MNNYYELDAEQREQFARDGVLVLKGFHDVEQDILPIQRAIYEIIGLVIQRHGLAIRRDEFSPATFDSGYSELIAAKRSHGSEIYDIVKQIPAFLRLVSHPRSEALFRALRKTDLAGIGTGSFGIRIDNPGEEQFRSHWHQEYLYQPQSVDGLVMWSPLLPIVHELGPVMYCRGSHHDGLRKYIKDGAAGKSGIYLISMHDEETVTRAYEQISPLTEPGDVIIMDYLTIHQSGYNVANRPRWSMQSRWFNFRDPTGAKIGWKASISAGTDIHTIFADYFVEKESA